MGLKKLQEGIDEAGKGATRMLIISAILGIVGLVFDIIPLLGIIASIIFIVAFVFELIGFLRLKTSDSIGEAAQGGVKLLVISMILAIVQSVPGILPLVGGIIGTVISLVTIVLVFFGWLNIQEGIIENWVKNPFQIITAVLFHKLKYSSLYRVTF